MIKIFIFSIISIFVFTNKNLATEIKIIAEVNNEIITNHDIEKERNYLEILNPNFSQLDINQKLTLAQNSLINEIIKKNEVIKFTEIETNLELLDNYIRDLYSSIGFDNEKSFLNELKIKKNYTIDEIKKKIKIELMWNDLIYDKYIDNISIDLNKIEKQLDKAKDTKIEYFISEIVFQKKKNLSIKKLYEEIIISIEEIGFDNTANIYSISETSKFGGKVGWINILNLPQKLRNKLDLLKIGEITDLIQLDNRFIILKVENKRTEEIILNRDEEKKKIIQFETNRQLKKFSKIYFDKIKLNYFINEK